ncbi:MAG TPA: L-threonylcarbamoyladenylate synthase [Nitrososphaerales archaeon]|nr:L-threonylcarbamoyladenylate synthase [Nitrososphaerales archaeon]
MPAPIMKIDHDSIAKAAGIVRKGGLVVYPTDTVYGLGADPFDEKAVQRLFAVKGRSAKPVPILCSSQQKAVELVALSDNGLKLARDHWPGALTLVAPLRKRLPAILTPGTGNLGVRVPAHRDCLELISACGGWLTGTSANLSGQPSARSAKEAATQLGDAVDLILDGGPLIEKESTVALVVGDEVTILRSGPIGVGEETKRR